jgi:hypothetical protein
MTILPLLLGTVPLTESDSAGMKSIWVGIGALVIFLILMGALLAFGKGREHS